MKTAFLFICIALLGIHESSAQEITELDASPLDLAIFRPDGQDSKPVARIIYSRPQRKERVIFGGLLPYDKIWRTGANQSTEINLYKDMVFEGNLLKAGNYTLYTIPGEKEWTLIFNSKLFTWGAYDYDASKDVLRIKVPVLHAEDTREVFGIAFGGEKGKGKLLLAWEHTEVYVNFTY